jgi:hypothetical protein
LLNAENKVVSAIDKCIFLLYLVFNKHKENTLAKRDKKPAPNVRLSHEAHAILKELAAKNGTTVQYEINKALLQSLRRRQLVPIVGEVQA